MLETKIEELTAAINKLVKTLETSQTSAPKPKTEPKTEPKVEPKVEPESQMEFDFAKAASDLPSLGALQAQCLELVRADRANKDRITALIGEHSEGGKLIKDIPTDNLAEFAKALGDL